MRYLYLQDSHIKGKNGVHRLGDYFSDVLLKLDEILSIAKENNCEAIIDGGDFLETASPSYIILDEIADRIEKFGIPMYSLLGNHAMRFGHIENSRYVGLSHLQKRSKLFHPMSDLKMDNTELIAIEYNYGIEEKLKENGVIFKSADKWKLAIIHALVMPKKFLDTVLHVTPKQIKTNGDLLLIAHYHHPYEIKVKDSLFLNIGCTGRNSVTEYNIHPSVLLLDTDKRTHEIIELKSAKPGEEVFNLEKVELKKEFKQNIDVFIQSLESTDFQGLSISGMITDLAKQKNVEKEVVELIQNKISEVNNV